jgi:hypothetical protein
LAEETKKITLQFVVDEASARKATTVLQNLTNEVSKLVEMSRRAAQSMGSIGQGAQVSAQAGGVNSQKEIVKMGPVGAALSTPIVNNANIIKGIAQATGEAHRQMSDGLKKSVSEQLQQIERLKRAHDSLAKDMSQSSRNQQHLLRHQIGQAWKGLPTPGEGPSEPWTGPNGWQAKGRIDSAFSSYATTNWFGPSPFGGGGGGGGRRDANGVVHFGEGGGGAAAPSGGGSGGGLAQSLGLTRNAQVLSTVLGALVAAKQVGGAVNDEGFAQSFDPFRRKALLGASFGAQAQSLRGGDIRSIIALTEIGKRSDLRDAFKDTSEGFYERQAALQAGKAGLAGATEGTMAAFGAGPGMRRFMDADTNAKNDLLKKMQMEIESDPVKYQYYTDFTNQAQGRVNAMRTFNMRGANDMLARYSARGIDAGQLSAALSAGEGVGGLSFGQRHMGTITAAQIGHFRGAENILAASAMSGSKNPIDLLRAVSGTSLDPGIASRYGQVLSQGMMDGRAFTSGQGYLGALTAFGGGTGAMGMRVANQVAAGQAGANALFQGTVDPYQQGRNLLSAIQAMPGGSIYGQEYMAGKMSFRQIADIVGGGDVPEALKMRGISSGAVKGFAGSVTRSIFDRFAGVGDTSEQTLFAKGVLANGGDAQGFVQSQLKGLKGSKLEAAKNKYATLFGTLLTDEGLADNDEAGTGMARSLLGLGSTSKGRRGFMDAAHKAKELAPLEGLASVAMDFNEWIKKMGNEVQNTYRHINPLADQFRNMGGAMTQGVGQVVDALGLLAQAAGGTAEALDKTGSIRVRRIGLEAKLDDASYQKAIAARYDAGDIEGVKALRKERDTYMRHKTIGSAAKRGVKHQLTPDLEGAASEVLKRR